MATTGTLAHNPMLNSQLTIPRTRQAENVGVNVDEATVFDAFIGSAEHRTNLLGPFNVIGIGQVITGGRVWTTHVFVAATVAPQPPPPTGTTVTAVGRIGGGLWTATRSGQVGARAGAPHLGQIDVALNQPVVGMTSTPSGQGYWLVASDGGIFSFGDAGFYGSTGAIRLNQPVVGVTSTPSGQGYWLVASDGGIFSFGDAGFYGSTGSIRLASPITGITRSATGRGYRMVAGDGGIFSFGDAPYFGSLGGRPLPQGSPVTAMAATSSGMGYWIIQANGTPYSFGDAPQA